MKTSPLLMTTPWKPGDAIRLRRHAVHVWWLWPPAARAMPEGLDGVLSDEERRQADGYRFPRDRAAFVVARAGLRRLLAAYSGDRPDRVSLLRRAGGKPAMAGNGRESLEFNLAHSDDLVTYAIAREDPVGIDVERVRPVEAALIARNFFTEREVQVVLGLRGESRDRAFYRLWVRKEAVLKASGEGLSMPLDSLDVTLGCDGEPPATKGRVSVDHGERRCSWTVVDLPSPRPGDRAHVAALAHRDPTARVRHGHLGTAALLDFARRAKEGATCSD